MDEDPANNEPDNLAVLCFDCHNLTQLRGGFGRHLDAEQVRRYREDWLGRVRARRDRSDRLAVEVMGRRGAPASPSAPARHPGVPRLEYVRSLPELRRRAYVAAEPGWGSGVTAQMIHASYEVIGVLGDILTGLATYYPAGHFDRDNPRDYISEVISSRFRWHRYHLEPAGAGQGGTIVPTMVGGSVMSDLEKMVEEMVASLTLDESLDGSFDYQEWKRQWAEYPGR